MKGLLFTEFLDSPPGVWRRLTPGRSRGKPAVERYQPGGHYDHGELLELVERLAGLVGVSRADLLRRFGRALFGHFTALYPVFPAGAESALAFLADIDTYVHGELQKIYPDAQFPVFECGAGMTVG